MNIEIAAEISHEMVEELHAVIKARKPLTVSAVVRLCDVTPAQAVIILEALRTNQLTLHPGILGFGFHGEKLKAQKAKARSEKRIRKSPPKKAE